MSGTRQAVCTVQPYSPAVGSASLDLTSRLDREGVSGAVGAS